MANLTGSRSSFPTSVDTFQELTDLSPSKKTSALRWQELKLQDSLTTSEQEEYDALSTQLSTNIFSAETLNKILDGVINLQTFFLNETEGYIETKQAEFDATLQKFTNKGNYSSVLTYQKWNTIRYNYETYMSLVDNNIGHTPVGDDTDTYWQKVALRGSQGQPGIGLSWCGNYNNSDSYSVGNAVYYGNSIYYCINASTGNLPTNTAYWQLFMSNTGITIQSTEPTNPYVNQVWINSALSYNNMKYWDGSAWIVVSVTASQIPIIDAGNYTATTNVETATQEIYKKLYLQNTIFTTTGSGGVYAVNINGITSLSELIGIPIQINFNVVSNVTSTLNPNSLGVISIKKKNGNSVANVYASLYTLIYNGTNFILQDEGGEYGTAVAAQVLSGYTIGTDVGLVSGTMTNQGAITKTISSQNGTYTIPKGYHNGNGVVTATLPSKAAATYTPTTTDQTISSGQYLAGDQIVKGDANLIGSNLLANMFGVTATGKRTASGTATPTGGNPCYITITGLDFSPSLVVIYTYTNTIDDNNRRGNYLIFRNTADVHFEAGYLYGIMIHWASFSDPHIIGTITTNLMTANGFTTPGMDADYRYCQHKWFAFE